MEIKSDKKCSTQAIVNEKKNKSWNYWWGSVRNDAR